MRTERRSNIVPLETHERSGGRADTIPQELIAYSQWVCWRYVNRGVGRKSDKQPVNPRNLANADVHWANTWTSFDEAYAAYLRYCIQQVHGIDFSLTQADPYVAVDLDSCVHEEVIESTAAQIIAQQQKAP